jgi:hypothetical protein
LSPDRWLAEVGEDAVDPVEGGGGVEPVIQGHEPAAHGPSGTEAVAAGVDSDELAGVAEEHRAAGVTAASAAVELAGDVLQEQEQVGEAVADPTLPAGPGRRACRG